MEGYARWRKLCSPGGEHRCDISGGEVSGANSGGAAVDEDVIFEIGAAVQARGAAAAEEIEVAVAVEVCW